MKQKLIILLSLSILILFTACSNSTVKTNENDKWEKYSNYYSTVVQYSGENDGGKKYLEIARKSAELFPVLEENVGAFVMDAYNYQSNDSEGTPLYKWNTLHYPEEIDPNGRSIRVSKNYFRHNPINASNDVNLEEQIIYDDMVLNILVPEKYKNKEEQIIKAYLENFYFEKVTAENHYNEEAGIKEKLEISKDDLKINIIYVKDNQKYFTFRKDCAPLTDNMIEDPIVQIYTSNIHCNYAHSILSQWCYFYSEKGSADEVYSEILPLLKQCGADNIKKVESICS